MDTNLPKKTTTDRYKQRISDLEREIAELKREPNNHRFESDEIKYQSVFHNAPIGILHYSKDSTITDCNARFVNLIGSSKEKLVGLNMYRDLKDKKLIHAVRQSLSDGFSTYEDLYSSVTADKKTKVKIVFKGIKDSSGNFIEGIGLIEDISLQYEAHLKLEASEHTYRTIFEQSAVGIAHIAPNAKLIRANSRFAEILGYSIDELREINFKSITHPEDQSLDNKFIIRALKDEISEFNFNKRYIHKSNRVVWTKLYGKVIRDYTDKIEYAIVAITDITQEKEIEKELMDQKEKYYQLYAQYLEQNHELKNYVHQLEVANANLRQAKEKAEESDKLKTSFLTNLSHEIRTPMNGIMGFATLLSNPKLTGEQYLEYRDQILQSGERMLSIINAIVDMSKIDANIFSLRLKEINLIDELNRILKPFEQEIKSKNLAIHKRFEVDNELLINTDPLKVEQIINILLHNAIKFTDYGEIEIGAKTVSGNYIIYVKDSGVGIPVKYHKTIFERFRQAPIENKLSAGAGLGLAIAKGLALQLGGNIWVESKPKQGSVFYVSIPPKQLSTEIPTTSSNQHDENRPSKY